MRGKEANNGRSRKSTAYGGRIFAQAETFVFSIGRRGFPASIALHTQGGLPVQMLAAGKEMFVIHWDRLTCDSAMLPLANWRPVERCKFANFFNNLKSTISIFGTIFNLLSV